VEDNKELKVGDVVVLKSGGPVMTVEEVGRTSASGRVDKTQVYCVWLDGSKKCSNQFHKDTLSLHKFTYG
jgi:uncharacterized protein YodC (DUF2158 family)